MYAPFSGSPFLAVAALPIAGRPVKLRRHDANKFNLLLLLPTGLVSPSTCRRTRRWCVLAEHHHHHHHHVAGKQSSCWSGVQLLLASCRQRARLQPAHCHRPPLSHWLTWHTHTYRHCVTTYLCRHSPTSHSPASSHGSCNSRQHIGRGVPVVCRGGSVGLQRR